jgi:TatD DNase family protein
MAQRYDRPMLVDSHAHLSSQEFDGDRQDVIARARDLGVTRIVDVGTNLETSLQAIALSEETTGIYAAIGFHPADSEAASAQALAQLTGLLCHEKVVAVGETGLDYYRDYAPREVQEASFRAHIRLANQSGLPLVIHSRAAEERVLEILKEEGARAGVLHCFSGNADQAARAVDLNFYLGFGGIVSFKNANALTVAKSVPRDRLVLETDCPFLAPAPYRGKRNEPGYVRNVAEFLCGDGDFDLFCTQTTANAESLFGLA